jgi:lipopolysaccharide/colanic/teichoic acid biosynthesis glycosyltransferase
VDLPSITSLYTLWQVSGRCNPSFNEWVELDLRYINNWSPWLDVRIILETIPAVFFRKGAW